MIFDTELSHVVEYFISWLLFLTRVNYGKGCVCVCVCVCGGGGYTNSHPTHLKKMDKFVTIHLLWQWQRQCNKHWMWQIRLGKRHYQKEKSTNEFIWRERDRQTNLFGRNNAVTTATVNKQHEWSNPTQATSLARSTHRWTKAKGSWYEYDKTQSRVVQK